VDISEEDQKYLFDIGVQFKFGNRDAIFKILKSHLPKIIQEFPIEVFFLKPDIANNVIALSSGGDADLKYLLVETIFLFIKKMHQRVQSWENFNLKNINYSNASIAFLNSSDKEYLRLNYPSIDWEKATRDYFETVSKNRNELGYSFISF
jgi:hypothetical protein